MMSMKLLPAALLALVVAVGTHVALAADAAPTVTSKAAATSVSTFHCLSIYWSPETGQAGKDVLVKFREAGQQAWHDGLPMRYNPVKTPECKADYRGSIVNLTPGRSYEIALALEGTDIRTSLKAATWSEDFPVASTVKCQNSAATLNVTKSGTPDGYILYDGTGTTIDCNNQSDLGISVDASYVILRGFTIKNVKQYGIRIINGHHIVIENCDISKWGSEETQGFGYEMQAGVFSSNKDVHSVVVQRCKIHNPSWNTNSWAVDHYKGRDSRHPDGPETIVFWEAQGNHVIRYNECWSDPDHYYNDIIGGRFNSSYRGFPGADSDIYGNYFANCWDDGMEIEGGNQNVRIWNNYVEETLMTIANAATSIGPLYIWRNVGGRSYTPPGSSWNMTHGYFMKMGYAGNDSWMTGHMYVFNNTVFQPKNEGSSGLGGDSKLIKHCTSRNNILHVRPGDTHPIATNKGDIDNSFDYDLLSADRYPEGQETHAVKGTPLYVPSAGFSFETKTGNFQLAPGSPGIGKGQVIPNFCDSFGNAPDMGAQQSGTPSMVYGVKAQFIPPTPTAR